MRTIKNNDLNNELDKLLSKANKLKDELNTAGSEEEKLRIKEDFLSLKKQMDILENDLSDNNLNETVEDAIVDNVETVEDAIVDNEALEDLYVDKKINRKQDILTEVIDENVFKDEESNENQTTILQFLKDNLKLLIFSTFVFIGIVWVFVYITSLTSSSKEIQVATGFLVSIALMATPFIKNVKQLTNVILSSTGYIVGLFTLLLGSVIFTILPQMLAIIISLCYLAFGVYKVKQLKSEFFNSIIILSSLLLTFAYYYVSAPFEILYIYIIVIIILFSLILTENNKISSLCLLYGSVFVTSILTSLLDNAIWNKVYEYEGDMDYSDLYGYIVNTDFKYTYIYPSIVLVALLFGIYYLKPKLTGKFEIGYKIFLGSMYLWIFSYLSFVSDMLYRTTNNDGILIFAYLLILGILVIVLNIQFKEMKEYFAIGIYLSSLASLYLVDAISTNYNFDVFCQLTIISILLIFGLYQKIDSLKFIGILSNLLGFGIILDTHGFSFYDELSGEITTMLIIVYYLVLNIVILYLYKSKLVENSGFIESKLDKLLAGSNQLSLQIYAVYISVVLLFIGYYFTEFIDYYFKIDLIFIDITTLLFIGVLSYIINLKNDSSDKKFYTPLFVCMNILIFGYLFINLVTFVFIGNDIKISFVNILDLILLVIYLNYIYTIITKVDIVPLLNKIKFTIDKLIILRLPIILFTGLILGSYLKGTIDLDIVYSIVFGFSIAYMVYELAILDKSEINNILLKIAIYLTIGFYLIILIFVLLADVSFIIKGSIFLLIGVYGIYTVIKKN